MDHHCRILFILTKPDTCIKSDILAAKDLIIIKMLAALKSKPRKFTLSSLQHCHFFVVTVLLVIAGQDGLCYMY